MEIRAAGKMARLLMKEHGVTCPFKWNENRTAGAQTFIAENLLTGEQKATKLVINRHYVKEWSEARVRWVVLHEIAHALLPYEAGHTPTWAAKCYELGIMPYEPCDVVPDEYLYVRDVPEHRREELVHMVNTMAMTTMFAMTPGEFLDKVRERV